MTFATDAPDTNEKEVGRHRFGSGPVLKRGATLDPQVFELLHETAEAEGIPFTVAASARSTGTDADAIHISRAGVPSGVVSVPLRYMHSPVEMVQLDDVERRAADRRVRAPARAGHVRPDRLMPAAALRHRRHAAPGGRSSMPEALATRSRGVHGVAAGRPAAWRPPGAPTRSIARISCSWRRVGLGGDRRARRRR